MILRWIDILKFANNGNPAPDKRVDKSDEEWKAILTAEEYRITRKKGTEKAHSSDICSLFEDGRYACICCNTPLFDSEEKFESGTGWPSFTQPLSRNAIAYHKDRGFGMYRIEAVCNTCDAHLGHVFQDGPMPSGLRFCINAGALYKNELSERKITFGGGCFWCTEAIFQQINGVNKVESGFSGGHIVNPTYREVASGLTGHVEVIQVTYEPSKITFSDLVKIHLNTHDSTGKKMEVSDFGNQYRSIIFYRNEDEKKVARELISDLEKPFGHVIVSELKMFEAFYKAEDQHQNYYNQNPNEAYCLTVINPKLAEFTANYQDKIIGKLDLESNIDLKEEKFTNP